MKEDAIYPRHVVDCVASIRRFTGGRRDAFFADRMTQKATLRELQEIAESTQRLSKAIESTEPDVPWQDIAGFRNVLVHGYLGLNLERIWSVIEHDLPPLDDAIQRMLSASPDEP